MAVIVLNWPIVTSVLSLNVCCKIVQVDVAEKLKAFFPNLLFVLGTNDHVSADVLRLFMMVDELTGVGVDMHLAI